MGRAECGAFQIQDTLFVGKVLSLRVVERNEGSFHLRRRIFRFEVSEPLVRSPRASEVVEIETGMGGGDCGYGFRIGESYLVDANHDGQDGLLSTDICNATRPEATAHNMLREIRAILAHERLPDLSGTVVRWDSPNVPSSATHPLEGVTVHLTPPNGNAYTATSDAEGIYSFRDLPASEYRIDFDLPPNLVSYDVVMQNHRPIKVPVSGGAACHRDDTAVPSGSISGQILDSSGKPMAVLGMVSLRKLGAVSDEPLGGWQDANGRFTIQFVPAGEYRIVFRAYAPRREGWMQPDPGHPQGTVSLREGEHIEGVQITVK